MKDKYEDIPCMDCICLAVCKGKLYTPLIEDCSIIFNYMERCRGEDIYNKRFSFLARVLSTEWTRRRNQL